MSHSASRHRNRLASATCLAAAVLPPDHGAAIRNSMRQHEQARANAQMENSELNQRILSRLSPGGLVFQLTGSLAPTIWVDAPSGASNPASVPAALTARFYRLSKP